MHSSPAMPTGTGRSDSSSRYTWVLAIGRPMVTVSPSPVSPSTALVLQIVVSVGP